MKRPFYAIVPACLIALVLVGSLFIQLSHSAPPVPDRRPPSAAGDVPPDVPGVRALPPTDDEAACMQGGDHMCLRVLTGTARAVYRITNPDGVPGFQPYQLVNFDQRLLTETSDAIEVEVTSVYHLDTHAPYPVDPASLPRDVRDAYLRPERNIQSDDPELAAQARELVAAATRQAEAVDAILTWVRAHVDYDYEARANDASSVFRDRRAVCAGFTNLSVAMLRAAGVPSRYQRGCATPYGYITGDGGGWHAWVEVYYPDVGWVASEPQSSANVIKPAVIFHGFDACGSAKTVISRVSYIDHVTARYDLRTPYDNAIRGSFSSASVPSWDRNPLQVAPSSPAVIRPISDPVGSFSLWVEDRSCGDEDWQVRTAASWLSPGVITGSTAGSAVFSIDASGLSTGSHTAPLTLYTTASPYEWDLGWATSRTVTAHLWLVDRVHRAHVPLVSRRR